MAQAQNVSANAVSGLQPLSYLNQNQPATVLFVKQVRSPTPNDKNYKIGTIWLNTKKEKVYLLVAVKNSKAIWSFLGAADGGFPITPFVVGPADEADFLTIQDAIDASNNSADQNGTIYIQPGIYTEDLSLLNKINLVSIVTDESQVVEIIGTHSPHLFGQLSIRGCHLTGTAAIISNAASGSATISFEECFFRVTDGFICDLPNWSGDVTIKNCDNASTSDGVFNNGGGSPFVCENSTLGQGITRFFTANGGSKLTNVTFECSTSFTGGQNLMNYCLFARGVSVSGNAQVVALYTLFSSPISPGLIGTTSTPIGLINCSIGAPTLTFAIDGTSTVILDNTTFLDSPTIGPLITLVTDSQIKGGSFAALKDGIQIKEGANARMGIATMAGGFVVVNNTSVTATTRIFISLQPAGVATGILRVSAIVPGVSFTISSTIGADTADVSWQLIEPA